MKDGQGFSATLRPNSELPHCCREGRNFSFVEREKSPQNFRKNSPILVGRTFWLSTSC